MSTDQVKIGAASLIELGSRISPRRTLVIQGETGVGKSEIVGQIGKVCRSSFYKDEKNCERMISAWKEITRGTDDLGGSWNYERGLPQVMRRLSEITEGDLLGIPSKGFKGATVFTLTDWLMFATEFPCVLFLDERNRANDAVKQSIFEIQDSHSFHGVKLHPETRVIMAENVGDQYNVQGFDPAEISRALLVAFKPTVKEWLEWARNNKVHPAIIEFISLNETGAYGSGILEFPGVRAPGQKYPDRRSWTQLSEEMILMKCDEDYTDVLFRNLACGMLGFGTGNRFVEFCKTLKKDITGEDVVKNWKKVKKDFELLSPEGKLEVTDRVNKYLGATTIVKGSKEAKNIDEWVHSLNPEMAMQVWAAIIGNANNISSLGQMIGKYVAEISQVVKTTPATLEEKKINPK